MTAIWIVLQIVLGVLVLFLGFLLLGALRALALLQWRIEQLEATMPSRLGRSGLKVGKKAPDFALPSMTGAEVKLSDYLGRQLFLAFTQTGCEPCHRIMPHLNKLQAKGEVAVIVINNGDRETTRKWASEVQAPFPVLVQEKFSLSKCYEVFATPFAFLIDERGVVASKGIINNAQHISFVLSGGRDGEKSERVEAELVEA